MADCRQGDDFRPGVLGSLPARTDAQAIGQIVNPAPSTAAASAAPDDRQATAYSKQAARADAAPRGGTHPPRFNRAHSVFIVDGCIEPD